MDPHVEVEQIWPESDKLGTSKMFRWNKKVNLMRNNQKKITVEYKC